MEINITSHHFAEIHRLNYNMDMVCMLKMIEEEVDVERLCEGSSRITSLHTSLLRKGLISDDDKITLAGKEILEFIESEGEKDIKKKKIPDEKFDKWWKTYPATDSFEFEGRVFSGSRGLKVKRDECRAKFNKILLEGDYTAEDLIRALEHEVILKKRKSVEEGKNKLSFMQNSLTYLNQRTFENFIEESKTETNETQVYKGKEI